MCTALERGLRHQVSGEKLEAIIWPMIALSTQKLPHRS
jgi:hypothetical protein